MEIKTKYGSIDASNLDDFDLSDKTRKILEDQMNVAAMFFSDEVDLTEFHKDYPEEIQEIAEIVIAESKFSEPERAFALIEALNGITLDQIEEANSTALEYSIDDGSEYLVLTDEEADEMALENEQSTLEDIGLDALNDSLKSYVFDNFVDGSWFDDLMEEYNRNFAEDIKNESSSDDDTYINRLHEEMVEYGVLDTPEWPDEDDFENYLSKDEHGSEPEEDEFDDADEFETAHQAWVDEGLDIAREKQTEHYERLIDDKIDDFVEKLNGNYDSGIEYFEENYGKEELEKAIKSQNLVDYEEVARYMIESNGRGNSLSRYDGEEDEVTITYKNKSYTFFVYRVD